MSHMGHIPPSGVKLSCIEFTEPFEAAVVAAAQIPASTGPRRASFPSMFPPGWSGPGVWSTP